MSSLRHSSVASFVLAFLCPLGATVGVAQQYSAAGAPEARAASLESQSSQRREPVNPAAVDPARPPARPFAPLGAEAQVQLQSVLVQWEQQSQGTKTLQADFTRWHYDPAGSPSPKQHARRSDGVLKYAKPDRGSFRVDRLLFFSDMENGKPIYKEQPGQFGEYWVCTGESLIEMDRSAKECKIQDLPASMRGTGIIDSPLPFVFNLDAAKIQNRYWVRQVAAPEGVILIEAWPKTQADRGQYKLVQIALDENTYLPKALIMYAPNFDPTNSPVWDHYEFKNVKRNSIGDGWRTFLNSFIPEKPPGDWKILRDDFLVRTNQ